MPLTAQQTLAIPALTAAATANGSNYKALVAVFLNGGMDSHNALVPRGAGYAGYADGRSSLALAEGTLLPLAGTSTVGMHPNMTGMQALWNSGKLAAVTNLGPLVEPMTKAEYGTDYVPGSTKRRPLALQSHSDQQLAWNSGLPDDKGPITGWAGRMQDMVEPTFNSAATVPATVTVAGRTRFQEGHNVSQYQMGPNGPDTFIATDNYTGGNDTTVIMPAMRALWDEAYTHPMEREVARLLKRADSLAAVVVAGSTPVTLTTSFPATGIGQQLRRAAILIGARASFNHRRDVFFTQMGGWDTHQNSLADHGSLLAQLDAAISAFNAAMVELGVDNQVTLFTMSDFGRSLSPNGSGTDHGWGGHSFVIGGAVIGGRFYNKPTPTTAPTNSFPDISIGGPYDGGQGRLVPTTSVDEYGATMCRWFGVPDALSNGVNPMDIIFPNLPRFSHRNLGFLP